MILLILGIVMFLIGAAGIVALIVSFKKISKVYFERQHVIDNANAEVAALERQKDSLTQQKDALEQTLTDARNTLAETEAKIEYLPKLVEVKLERAYDNYISTLENSYQEKENNYDKNVNKLSEKFIEVKQQYDTELEDARTELSKVRETRAAAIQAQLREEEIKKQLAFYCVQVSKADLADIKILEDIKIKLNNPRILSMLIWSTYFQKPMTTLCNNILGANPVCGIYKITNQINGKCYVGQARDMASRFKEHAKCGLGIDTPQRNKLYAAMIEDGLWNFSFELLEKCPVEQLNEKERYYIDLYQSKDFGYNTTRGVGE